MQHKQAMPPSFPEVHVFDEHASHDLCTILASFNFSAHMEDRGR